MYLPTALFSIEQVLNHTTIEVDHLLGAPKTRVERNRYENRFYESDRVVITVGFRNKVARSLSLGVSALRIENPKLSLALLGLSLSQSEKMTASPLGDALCCDVPGARIYVYLNKELAIVRQVSVSAYERKFGELYERIRSAVHERSSATLSSNGVASVASKFLGKPITALTIDEWRCGRRPSSLEITFALVSALYSLDAIHSTDLALELVRAAGFTLPRNTLAVQLISTLLESARPEDLPEVQDSND